MQGTYTRHQLDHSLVLVVRIQGPLGTDHQVAQFHDCELMSKEGRQNYYDKMVFC